MHFEFTPGYGKTIEQSYKFGCNAIQLQISDNSNFRSALSEEERKLAVATTVERVFIPEHLKPVLKINPNLASNVDKSTSDVNKNLLPSTKLDIQSYIDKALEKEIALRQYPQDKEYLADKNFRSNSHSSSPKKTCTLFIGGTVVAISALVFSFFHWTPPIDECNAPKVEQTSSSRSLVFKFNLQEGGNPGIRKWYKCNNGSWIEQQPKNISTKLSFVRKDQIDDIEGTILKKTEPDGSYTQIFVPDRESRSRSLFWSNQDYPHWNKFNGKITY